MNKAWLGLVKVLLKEIAGDIEQLVTLLSIGIAVQHMLDTDYWKSAEIVRSKN